MREYRKFDQTLEVSGGFSWGNLWIGAFVAKGFVELGIPFFRLTIWFR